MLQALRGANWSERANLDKEDQADDLLFSEVIWKAVKDRSRRSRRPSVRRSFVQSPKKTTTTMMTTTIECNSM